jgi:hypothetical protein
MPDKPKPRGRKGGRKPGPPTAKTTIELPLAVWQFLQDSTGDPTLGGSLRAFVFRAHASAGFTPEFTPPSDSQRQTMTSPDKTQAETKKATPKRKRPKS